MVCRLLLALGFLAFAAPALAAPPAIPSKEAAAGSKPAASPVSELKVRGPAGKELILKPAEFTALAHITLKADIHGKSFAFEGVELTTLLAKVDTPTGQQLRGPAVADVVIVGASDGYHAAFALIETDPRFKASKIIVADKVDGAPIDPRDGPFRMVVEGDLDAARLVRNLATIEVKAWDAGATKKPVAAKPKATPKPYSH